MKYTTATFAAAMSNVLPAVTFVMACIFRLILYHNVNPCLHKCKPNIIKFFCHRLEKFKLKSIHSQAKLAGTVATVAGAMLMTLLKGPVIELPWTKGSSSDEQQRAGMNLRDSIKGSLMITIGCFSWACFMILQVTRDGPRITVQRGEAELHKNNRVWVKNYGSKIMRIFFAVKIKGPMRAIAPLDP